MSLINNALKKAQRQRTADGAPVDTGSTPPIRRGKSGLPLQTLVLILAGAAVIVVLSVVATVYLLRPAPAPALAGSAPVIAQATPVEPAPVISTQAISHAEPAGETVAPAQATTENNSPAPTVSLSPEPPKPAAAEPAQADERVYAFIDNLQVMGVRSSGNESKVLMNDRVYRVNDIVDRALALRLVQVAPERLVFEDANGITYTKTF